MHDFVFVMHLFRAPLFALVFREQFERAQDMNSTGPQQHKLLRDVSEAIDCQYWNHANLSTSSSCSPKVLVAPRPEQGRGAADHSSMPRDNRWMQQTLM